jgi:hypothetical protein
MLLLNARQEIPKIFLTNKQLFSLNVQAVCDSKAHFMDVECKWPGSVHDAKVFANSCLCKLTVQNFPSHIFHCFPGYDPIPNYIIGDPAYPLTQFCMKEYQYCTNNRQDI